jgi:hypothetical protein
MISWDFVRHALSRDEVLVSKGKCRMTRLTQDMLNLDGFDSMNVNYAMVPSEDLTIEELLSFVSQKMSIECPIGCDTLVEKFNFLSLQDYRWDVGLNPLPTIEYLLNLNTMFNNFLLDKKIKITLQNIQQFELKFQFIMENYFGNWKQSTNLVKEYLAHQTDYNLKRTVRGFFNLCSDILNLPESENRPKTSERFVNPIFGNTSALEVIFCQQRNGSFGKVDPQNYATKMGITSDNQLNSYIKKSNTVFKQAQNRVYLDEQVDTPNVIIPEMNQQVYQTESTIQKQRDALILPFKRLLANLKDEMDLLELPGTYNNTHILSYTFNIIFFTCYIYRSCGKNAIY